MQKMYLCYFTVYELMEYLRRGYYDSVDVLITNGRGDEADELETRYDLIHNAHLDTEHEWNAYKSGEFHEWLCMEIETFHRLTADIV